MINIVISIELFMKLIRFTFFLAILAAIGYGIFYYMKLKLLNDAKDRIQTNYL